MAVVPERAASRHEHGGRTYYFCSRNCLEKFRAEPGKYLTPAVGLQVLNGAVQEKPTSASARQGEYTCPMHPEIVRFQPGACPICGMALERRAATLEEEISPELEDMSQRFWVSLALTAPVLLVAMSEMFPG